MIIKIPSARVTNVIAAIRIDPSDPLVVRYAETLIEIGNRVGSEVLEALDVDDGYDSSSTEADADERSQALVEGLNSIEDKLAAALVDDPEEKLRETMDRIREVFDSVTGFFQGTGETDAVGAAQLASMEARQQGGLKLHAWATMRDDAVRESHAAQDGVQVRIGRKFPNGQRYPGEPTDPAEYMNCRCELEAPDVNGRLGSYPPAGPEVSRLVGIIERLNKQQLASAIRAARKSASAHAIEHALRPSVEVMKRIVPRRLAAAAIRRAGR